jgi:hypothetical protein
VGAVIGAATGLVAPFLYLPVAEWFFEMNVPRDWLWFWNDFVTHPLRSSRRMLFYRWGLRLVSNDITFTVLWGWFVP